MRPDALREMQRFGVRLFFFLCAITQVSLAQGEGQPADADVKTWGATLNPGGQVPQTGFRAFYINTNDPRTIIASENVADVAINYSWSEFHGIKSEDFGAYWVGWLKFSQAESRIIEVSQSWSKARIIVDGKIAYEGAQNARQPFSFTKGMHLVEVEYINNWHTTSFRVNFGSASAPRSQAQVIEELRAPEFRNAEVHYVGQYESSAKDLSVSVQVAASARPVILVFSSYDAIKWIVSENKRGTVRAIVFGSHNPGSEVRGVDSGASRVIQLAGPVGSYDMTRRCSCVAGHFHCESSGNLLDTASAVERLTGYPLTSFNGAYSKDQVSVPGLAFGSEMKEQARASAESERREQEKCARDANPDMNRIFDKPPPAPTGNF